MKMKTGAASVHVILLLLVPVASLWLDSTEGATCRPSGRIRGEKPPPRRCNRENDSECCRRGRSYPTFKCSPPVSHHTKAILTLNSFEKGGDGGGPSECDNKFHSDNTPVVALSTGWFNDRKRCHHNITIFGNGRRVHAVVASQAVWKALGVPKSHWGELNIHWSDA